MSHPPESKTKLIARVMRIKGQVEAVERALKADVGCADVLMLVASLRGAVHGLSAQVMEEHIRFHVVNPDTDRDRARAKGAAELIEVVRTYLK
jgi:DNA-binding FrmR family transcriptional regulator